MTRQILNIAPFPFLSILSLKNLQAVSFFLPEVVGSAGILVDPLDVEAIARFCKQFCIDSSFREEYVKKGMERAKQFRWEDAARKMVALFNTLM